MHRFSNLFYQPKMLGSALAMALCLTACGDQNAGDVAADGTSAPLELVAAPAGTNWAETVSKTEANGYIMGNPAAPIKLVEYASLTCGACANFSAEAFEDLRDNYVMSGRVSFELRNYVRDPLDLTTAMLTRCGANGSFFALTEQAMTNQAPMFAKAQAIGEEEYDRIIKLPDNARYLALAGQLGLIDYFSQRGISTDQANSCLTDVAAANGLADMTGTASKEYDIAGTPTFLINNQKVDFIGWNELESKLQQMGAR